MAIRLADAKPGHHPVTGHVENFAAMRLGCIPENPKELLEQGHNLSRPQPFGNGGIASHIGKQDRRPGRFRGLRRQEAAGLGNSRSYSFFTTA